MLHPARGLSLIEVTVAVLIFLFGIVALLNFFPFKVRSVADAADLTEAVLLAQMKAEEIRRDNAADSFFFLWLRGLTAPTPTAGIPFGQSNFLRYAFSGRSVLDPVDDAGVPEDDYGVPRIIVFTGADATNARSVLYPPTAQARIYPNERR